MKDIIIKALLVILIVVHILIPIVKLAVWGYDTAEMMSDVYSNGVIVILSAAILRLYHSKDAD